MASSFYSRIGPNYGDLDNESGGFLVEVKENDGGIGLIMSRLDDKKGTDFRGVFYTPEEAEELVAALQEAIERARTKKKGKAHPSRVRDE